MKKLLLLSVFAFVAANAALIPALDVGTAGVVVSVDDQTGETTYAYTYLVTLNDGARLSGDREEYFTIYDFTGFETLFSVTPPGGWSVTTPQVNVGETPLGIGGFVDDPDLPNLTFNYEGPAVAGGAAWAFVLHTSVGPGYTRSYFSSQSTNTALPDSYVRNWGEVLVPSPDSGEPGEIPEPLTMGLLGGGLAGIGLLRRLRKA